MHKAPEDVFPVHGVKSLLLLKFRFKHGGAQKGTTTPKLFGSEITEEQLFW